MLFEVRRGATPGAVAGILAATLLPFSIVGPFAGVVVDRWDRRRVLVVVSAARVLLATLAIGVLVLRSEPLAYVGVVLLLSSSRFVLAAKGAALPRTVPVHALVTANGISSLAGMIAAFLGAVVTATYVSAAPAAAFVVAALLYTAAASAFTRLPPVGGGAPGEAVGAGMRRVARELAEGVRAIVDDRAVRSPLLAVWLHRFLLGAGFIVLVLVADGRYHFEASGYGLALAVTGVGAFAGTVTAPLLTRRYRAEGLLAVTFLLAAVAALVGGFAPSLAVLVTGVGVVAFAFQVLKVLVDALVGRAAADVVRGRVFAAYDILYNVAFVVAGLALVPVWRLGRERALLWGVALGFVAAGAVVAHATRSWPFVTATPARPADRHRRRRRWLALVVGALPVLAFPTPALWWLAWIALVPFMLVVRSAPTRREGGLVAWWGGTGFMLAMHHWLLPNLGPFIVVAGIALGALWIPWGLVVQALLHPPMTTRRIAAACVVVPSAWVAIEAIRSWERLGGPWGLLGATQWNEPATLAPVALGGVWLVSFLVVMANVGTVVAVAGTTLRLRAVGALAVTGAVLFGPLWAAVRPAAPVARAIRIAVVQPGVVDGPTARFARNEALTRALAGRGVTLVLWGESSVGFDLEQRADLQQRLVTLSRELDAPILVNVDARRGTAGGIFKSSLLLTGEGIAGRYDKMRLVPFGEYVPLRFLFGWTNLVTRSAQEDRRRGSGLAVLDTGHVRIGPLVCFESAFPDMSRRLANRGADLLVFQSSTSTFQGSWAPEQHSSLAAVRAVETGRTAVHATLTGASAAFDGRGHRLAHLGTRERGSTVVTVPITTERTPYDRYGDWVLIAAFAVLGIGAMTAAVAAARTGPAPGSGRGA